MQISQFHSAVEHGEALPKLQRKVRRRKPTVYRRPPPSDWLRTLEVLSKQWRWAALFALCVTAIVTAVTFAIKPVYESEGRMQIDPPGSEVFSLDASGVGLIDSEYIATEAEKLQFDDLALATIRALKLDKNPEFMSKTPGRSVAVSNSGQETPSEIAALRNFKPRLSVRRDPSSRLVGVSFAAHDPRLSADVVNTLMKLMVQQTYESRGQAISESSKWLAKQLDDIKEKMEKSAHELANYGAKMGIADVDPNSNTYAEKMGDLNKQLVTAEADRIQLESFLRPGSDPELLPQVRNNLVIQALTQKLSEAESQLAQSGVIYGPNHSESRKLQAQVIELQKQIKAQRAAIVGELKTNYRAARAREALLNGEVKGATSDLSTLAQYNTLKRQALADRELYNSLYAKTKEAGISAASKSSNIRIVSQARMLDRPTRPNRPLNILAGSFVGVIGGIALALVKARLQDRIHSVEEIRDWTGLPSVTVVPEISSPRKEISLLGKNLKLEWNGGEERLGPDCFLLQRPNSPESEAVQAMRTMLFTSGTEDPPKVVLVTSPLPGEGKTTLANNLAIALSKHGKTCLLDADLRNPSVSESFKLVPRIGLEHYLQGTATLEQVMIPSGQIRNLTIIPAVAPTEEANYLLTGDQIKTLVGRLRERFDFVVIDTPPILPYADGLGLSTLVDGVILIGRAGQTPRGAITRSMELLDAMKSAPILTVVLNAADAHHGYGSCSY
jgi:succinoglycan biosynthesis transport protein ExoP